MDVSIVLLNYRQKRIVKQAIRGIILAQPRLSYEIVFVDNDSRDGSTAMVREMFATTAGVRIQPHLPMEKPLTMPPANIIDAGSNGGFSAGNNIGMKAAKGKYVLVMNPDIAIVPGVLEKLFAFMEEHPDVGIVGPRLLNPDGSIQYSCRRFPRFFMPLYRRTVFGSFGFAQKSVEDYLMKDFDHRKTIDVDWLFGAFLFIRKTALDQVGYFDDRFFMYFEDLDLCRRFWEKGYRVVYHAETELVHYHHQYSAEKTGVSGILSKGGRIHLLSGFKYYLKYIGKPIPQSGDSGQG